MASIRIMCWNIAEGSMTGALPANSTLPRIVEQIQNLSPDLVLLNEVKNWRGFPFGSGVNQVQKISELTGLSYSHWGNTVATGLTGHKAVAVLSRHLLGSPTVHRVIRNGSETAFATIETTVRINNIVHHIFSTRFAPKNSPDHTVENALGIAQSVDLVQKIDNRIPVIFGGDFNAEANSPEMINCASNIGLKDAYTELPDPEYCGVDPSKRIDFIFYRGPYRVNVMQYRCPWASENQPSDHPWVFVELFSTESDECVKIRDEIASINSRLNKLGTSMGRVGVDRDKGNPGHKRDAKEIQEEKDKLIKQRAELLQQAAAKGCAI